MRVLSRRLFNGGFNHLKSTSSLLYRTPRIVGELPCTRKHHSDAAVYGEVSSDSNKDSELEAGTVSRPASCTHHDHHYRQHSATANMSDEVDFVPANEEYIRSFGSKGDLRVNPTKKLIVVTCMDARLNPFSQLGITEGQAHIIRNAGGLAKDSLRSIIISQRLLGTRKIAVFRHTDCGMTTFTTPELRQRIRDSDPGNELLNEVDKIDFLEFKHLEKSLRDDVRFLRENPLVLPETTISGWIYHVETGKITEVI